MIHPLRAAMLAITLPATLAAGVAAAQNEQDLAKQLANPVASLISVPFQYNLNGNYPPQDGYQSYVNIQPVIPFSIGENWNVISRTILPVVYQKDIGFEEGSEFGLGMTTQSFFLSPKQPTDWGLIWGLGPVFLLPTATSDELGTDQWGAGVTGVGLRQSGQWTYGVLWNHIWSLNGDDEYGEINQTFLQPFLNYTTRRATSFVLNTESTYYWDDSEWGVPVNFGVYQMLKLGNRPVQIGGGVRYWFDSPEGGPEDWGIRATVTFLFPTGG